jgi:hypothetical protein
MKHGCRQLARLASQRPQGPRLNQSAARYLHLRSLTRWFSETSSDWLCLISSLAFISHVHAHQSPGRPRSSSKGQKYSCLISLFHARSSPPLNRSGSTPKRCQASRSSRLHTYTYGRAAIGLLPVIKLLCVLLLMETCMCHGGRQAYPMRECR